MHRDDKSRFLLYIEPKASEKLSNPIADQWTALMTVAFGDAIKGASNYNNPNQPPRFHLKTGFKGMHRTECGEGSTPHDYMLANGLITNSLAGFYLSWYRNSITENDWDKLNMLKQFYDENQNPSLIIPCEYCGERHLKYACDKQIEFIKNYIKSKK